MIQLRIIGKQGNNRVGFLGATSEPLPTLQWVAVLFSMGCPVTTKYHGSPTDGNAYWYSKDFMEPVPAVRGEVPGTEPNVVLRGSWSVTPSYLNGTVAPDGTWTQHRDPKLGHAQLDGGVNAVLRWIRNTDENGDPDPNDNPPPSVWIWEQARATVVRSHTRPNNDPAPNNETLYNQANPYQGGLFDEPTIACTFGSKNPEISPVEKEQGGGSTLYGSVTNTVVGQNLYRQDTGGRDVIPLSAVHFNIRVGASNPGWYDLKSQVADIRCEYVAKLVDISLSARPKGYPPYLHDGTLNPVVAAGGKDSDIHQAEVIMQVHTSSGTPIVGIQVKKLPKLVFKLNTDNGEQKDAEFYPIDDSENTPSGYDSNAVTDENGGAVRGILLSRDVTYSTHGPMTLEVEGISATSPRVQVEATDFIDGPFFGSLDAALTSGAAPSDTLTQVHVHIGGGNILVDDAKIKDHKVNFFASRVLIAEQDEMTGNIFKKFVVHPDYAPAARPTVDVTTGIPIEYADTSPYVECLPAEVSANAGTNTYVGQVRIKTLPARKSVVEA